MKNQEFLEFLKATLIRAVRTAAQVALGMITVGAAISDIDWAKVASVSAVSAVYSILTSIVSKPPEIQSQGKFLIDDSNPEKTLWTLKLDCMPEDLKPGESVRFLVTNAKGGEDDAALG